jgi:metal-sulfur cluster biosynthetic enzyme
MMNFFKKTPPADTTQVLAALARVVHPEQRRDIVQLKMVKDLATLHLDFIAQKNGYARVAVSQKTER